MTLLLVLACTPSTVPGPGRPALPGGLVADGGIAEGTVTPIGEASGANPLEDLSIVPADAVATVLVATWHTARPCTGAIAYGLDDDTSRGAREQEATQDHRLLLLGLPAESRVTARVTCPDDADPGPVEQVRAETGALPPGTPAFAFEGTPDAPGAFFTAPLMEAVEIATIVDAAGRVVWAWREEPGAKGTRVRVAADGRGVLYNVQDQQPGGPDGSGGIVRVSWDGAETERVSLPGQSHDFVELPDGTLASLAIDTRTFDGEEWGGDRLVEIAPDGAEREIWSAWDTWTPATAPPSHAEGTSWTHANAVDYDPATDTYWVGLRDLSAIVRIDRATGELLDQVGGPTPTWPFADGSTPLDGQHQFERRGDTLLVFDNQYNSEGTRVVRYTFDHATQTLVQEWALAPEEGWYEYALGDVAEAADGGVRATWSMDGTVRAYDGGGEALWSMAAPAGVWIGYSERLDRLP